MHLNKITSIAVMLTIFVFGILGTVSVITLWPSHIPYIDERATARFHVDLNDLQQQVQDLDSKGKIKAVVLSVNPRLSSADVQAIADEFVIANKRYGIPISLLLALTFVESTFNSRAESHVGAKGIMQIMPETGTMIGPFIGIDWSKIKAVDIRSNIQAGAWYLNFVHNSFVRDGIERPSEWDKTLVAYNAGPGFVRRLISTRQQLPTEYTSRVFTKMFEYDKLKFDTN